MQRANCIVRLGGLMTNTVPKLNVTPAEILILQHIHGGDAVVDIRPTDPDPKIRQEAEYERLSERYDRAAGAFKGAAGEEDESIMARLFPGAIKRLPTTFKEIGLDIEEAALAPAPTPVPDLPEITADDMDVGGEGDETETVEAEGETVEAEAADAEVAEVDPVVDPVAEADEQPQ